MTLHPCLDCGEPSSTTRCPDCRPRVDMRASTTARGYDRRWRLLSERARRLQPFCSDCGTADDLTVDHSPEAWRRREEGKVIRLEDVAVVCRTCNVARGSARGETPTWQGPRPPVHPKSESVMKTITDRVES